mmetsp:Transcript_7159/g.20356  ORF Transcript_7159/g.20356 Transcript_7159/m.20356 type:complete len:206 (-) Transcript_7159:291-908(-)
MRRLGAVPSVRRRVLSTRGPVRGAHDRGGSHGHLHRPHGSDGRRHCLAARGGHGVRCAAGRPRRLREARALRRLGVGAAGALPDCTVHVVNGEQLGLPLLPNYGAGKTPPVLEHLRGQEVAGRAGAVGSAQVVCGRVPLRGVEELVQDARRAAPGDAERDPCGHPLGALRRGLLARRQQPHEAPLVGPTKHEGLLARQLADIAEG